MTLCRFILSLPLVLLLASGPAPARDEPAVDGATAAHHAACRHFRNRAMFRTRGDRAPLVVILAEACRAALASLQPASGATDEDRAQAADFLDRLSGFKSLIVRMTVERAFAPGSPRLDSAGRIVPLGRPVTATGEYLIAREFGLLDAYRAFMRSGPRFAGPMLSPPPLDP
jgi:hypothetical protein